MCLREHAPQRMWLLILVTWPCCLTRLCMLTEACASVPGRRVDKGQWELCKC